MRTVTELRVNPQCLELKADTELEEATLDLVRTLLREERVAYLADSILVSRGELLDAYAELKKRRRQAGGLPTDPASSEIASVAAGIAAASARNGEQASGVTETGIVVERVERDRDTLSRRLRAIRHGLAILAQIPPDDQDVIESGLRDLLHDRDNDVYGLLFQQGTGFTIRLRHHSPDRLKAATEKVVNILAPRPAADLDRALAEVKSISSIKQRLEIDFLGSIEMKTPAGELAQTGHVHVVRSQLGLLGYLATRAPQIWLVWLTAFLAGVDLVWELFLAGSASSGFSWGGWIAQFCARLSTGAFGAYLVALFTRYGEIRKALRSDRRSTRRLTSAAYGAVVEWTTAES
ncbi:MAG TPA: hypothetical protein VGP36_04060 [Mycobacteriales bacterium]|jgi:hypothetical protein|nr:hypothetical protein [Mycobacteriales bacterium]